MPGITVRLGSERMTASSTSSSTTTITRSEANAASFCTPTRPHICVLPAASARCACTIVTPGLSAGTRIAGPGKDEFPGAARGDHLVVDQVRREPGQREVATPLADDLVTRGEADEMGETFDDDGVTVVDEAGDGIPHRHDLGRHLIRHFSQALVDDAQRGVHVVLVHDEWWRES